MPAAPDATAEHIKDVNTRYHDVAAETYDAKWGIDFGEIGQAQVAMKLAKALGEDPWAGRSGGASAEQSGGAERARERGGSAEQSGGAERGGSAERRGGAERAIRAGRGMAAPAPFGDSLEIGAGTGYFTLNMAQLGLIERPTATDISPGMLASLEASAERLGIEVTTVACEAEELPFADDSFDLVFGHAILHHIPDLGTAFSEFRRVLRPGGRIAFCGEPSRYGDRLAAVPKRAGVTVAPLWRAALRAPARSDQAAGGPLCRDDADVSESARDRATEAREPAGAGTADAGESSGSGTAAARGSAGEGTADADESSGNGTPARYPAANGAASAEARSAAEAEAAAHGLEPEVDVHSFAPADLRRAADAAGFDEVRVKGEELLANMYGWGVRTMESTAEPEQIPVGWRLFAYRSYLALQTVDSCLLEPYLPPELFYNLLVSARKPNS